MASVLERLRNQTAEYTQRLNGEKLQARLDGYDISLPSLMSEVVKSQAAYIKALEAELEEKKKA